jgi:hypothetical protein
MATQSTLNWNEIDPSSLPEIVQANYAAYKHAYMLMKEERRAFEGAINEYAMAQGVIRAEQELAVAYNFGKLSVAVAPKRERKAGKRAIALGDIAS